MYNKYRQINKRTNWHTNMCTNTQMNRQTNGQMDKQTDGQRDRQTNVETFNGWTDKWAHRQIDRHVNGYTGKMTNR